MCHFEDEVSNCCNAPLVLEFVSDPTNYSDDDYDLKVLQWVCSSCHAVVARKIVGRGQSDAAT